MNSIGILWVQTRFKPELDLNLGSGSEFEQRPEPNPKVRFWVRKNMGENRTEPNFDMITIHSNSGVRTSNFTSFTSRQDTGSSKFCIRIFHGTIVVMPATYTKNFYQNLAFKLKICRSQRALNGISKSTYGLAESVSSI